MNVWRNMLTLWVIWLSLHIGVASAMLDISRTADGYILPLSALTSELDPLELVGADSRKEIAFPLSRRLNVKSVELQLVFTNSVSLLEISQLAVLLNGSVLGQFPLKANTPEVTARMVLPLDKLKAGYNRIGFNAAMHYTLDCEDPLHSELWTKIDLERSFISVKADYKNVVDATLADLPDLIDRRLWEEYEITLATVGTVSRETLESGALIAQGAAMFRDYAPLRIKHTTLRRGGTTAYLSDFFGDVDWAAVPKGDVIVFGTRDELRGILGSKIANLLDRPLMAVYPRPDDPTRFVLVISGQTSADLLRSVKTFALKNVLYPKNFAASPINNTFPDLGVMEGIGRLKSHVLYRFSDLGYQSTTLEGMGVPSTSLRVWMIPDSFAPRKDSVELKLYMAYGAGFSKQSVLNVIVNGRYESTIPMDDPRGVVYMGYKVNIPVSRFKAGWNDVRFEAQMQPDNAGGHCKTIPTKNLQVSIFDESNIRLRSKEGKAFVQNLELIAGSGLPFLHYPDGKNVGIYMPQPNSGTMAASWMMMAKLAQLNKAPLYNTSYYLNSMEEASKDNDSVIVVAEQSAIPPDLRDQAPLDILRRAREEVRVGHEVAEIHRLWGLAAFLPTALREYMGLESTVRLTGKDAALQLNADFSRESALVLMPNPDTFGKTVLLVTGATGGKLADDMSSLVQFLPWGSLKGDVAVWRSDRSLDNMVRTAKITDEHATASASFAQIVGLKISQHPWWALLGAILLIFVFGLITHFALVKYQRRLFKKRNQS
jgi:hypothetical protein